MLKENSWDISVFGAFFLICCGPATAQSVVQLPVDADNCAIHRALSPETAHTCMSGDLGQSRGIVLRIDDAVKPSTANTPLSQVNPQTVLGQTPPTRPLAPTVRVARASTRTDMPSANRGAAEAQNGYFVQFAFNSTEIEPQFKVHLDRLSDVLKVSSMLDSCVKVIGHTDTVGSAAYNKKLSEMRALKVAAYLVDERGIDRMRLALEAAGETKPLPDVPGNDALNRRVEFATKKAQSGC